MILCIPKDNGLTEKGREQCVRAVDDMVTRNDFSPTFIWTSNTYRAYQSAEVIANEIKLGYSLTHSLTHSLTIYSLTNSLTHSLTILGQNRIVPEYSFLDARAMGFYEGSPLDRAMNELHHNDEIEGDLLLT